MIDVTTQILLFGVSALLSFCGLAVSLASRNAVKRLGAQTVSLLGVGAAIAALGAPQAVLTAVLAVGLAQLVVAAAIAIRLQETYGGAELDVADRTDAQSDPAERR